MNKLNIAATGFPATTETWKFIARAYEDIFKGIGELITLGDPVILSGVGVSGTSVSSGYVVINGEILPFIECEKTDVIGVVEEVQQVSYNTDINNSGTLEVHDTYYTRYAKCVPVNQDGLGPGEYYFSDFRRIKSILDIDKRTDQASETTFGVAKIATEQDVIEGTDNEKYLTPAKLKYALDNANYRALAKFKINSAAVNFGENYSNYEIFDLPVSVDPDEYMVLASLSNTMLSSPQPILFSYNVDKYNDHIVVNWVLDARLIQDQGDVSGEIDIIVVYIGG